MFILDTSRVIFLDETGDNSNENMEFNKIAMSKFKEREDLCNNKIDTKGIDYKFFVYGTVGKLGLVGSWRYELENQLDPDIVNKFDNVITLP